MVANLQTLTMKLEKVKKRYSSHVLKKRKNNDSLLNECL